MNVTFGAVPAEVSAAIRSISGSGSIATTESAKSAKARESWPGPQPRSRTRCTSRSPQDSATRRIKLGEYGRSPGEVMIRSGAEATRVERNRRGHVGLRMRDRGAPFEATSSRGSWQFHPAGGRWALAHLPPST